MQPFHWEAEKNGPEVAGLFWNEMTALHSNESREKAQKNFLPPFHSVSHANVNVNAKRCGGRKLAMLRPERLVLNISVQFSKNRDRWRVQLDHRGTGLTKPIGWEKRLRKKLAILRWSEKQWNFLLYSGFGMECNLESGFISLFLFVPFHVVTWNKTMFYCRTGN